MKKILLAVALSGLATLAFGQGQVQFRNYWTSTTPAVNASVTDKVTGLPLDSSNSNWRAALLGGPTTATPASLTVEGTLSLLTVPGNTAVTWVNFRSGTTPPFASGYVNNSTGIPREIPSVNWGGQAIVQMVAWEGPYTTWAAAWAAAQVNGSTVKIGVSNPLTLTLPTSVTDQNLTYLWGLNSFAIAIVPEPTAFALAGLGAAALLIFRRRN